MKENQEIFNQLRGGLIVSCQALENEPLYGSATMLKMAYAAMLGGAKGIRANTPADIEAIKTRVDLPIIGLYKQVYEGSEVYITPTMKEIDALMETAPEIIAMDATDRKRPGGIGIEEFFGTVREKYPRQLFMADCSCYEDVIRAQKLGFDLAGTTLCGYTKETEGIEIPSFELLERLSADSTIPIIAEGGIWLPEQLRKALDCGAFAAVVGTAITRPMEITKRYVKALED